MIIEEIDYIHRTPSRKINNFREKTPQDLPREQQVDTYESSIEDRAEMMKSIKEKIKSGYYNSEAVLDDLSHSFANALDQLS